MTKKDCKKYVQNTLQKTFTTRYALTKIDIISHWEITDVQEIKAKIDNTVYVLQFYSRTLTVIQADGSTTKHSF